MYAFDWWLKAFRVFEGILCSAYNFHKCQPRCTALEWGGRTLSFSPEGQETRKRIFGCDMKNLCTFVGQCLGLGNSVCLFNYNQIMKTRDSIVWQNRSAIRRHSNATYTKLWNLEGLLFQFQRSQVSSSDLDVWNGWRDCALCLARNDPCRNNIGSFV